METTISQRLKAFIDALDKSTYGFAKSINVSQSSIATILIRDGGISSDIIKKIIIAYPMISLDWLLTGEGEMFKSEYHAGRDNNVVKGNNEGVVGSGNTVGNVGGNHVSIGEAGNIKKIMDEEGVSLEFAQSLDSLQQTNNHLKTRIKDLEALNASKDKIIETMQLLIDTLATKK